MDTLELIGAVEYGFSNDDSVIESDTLVKYIGAGNGLFEIKETDLLQITSKATKVEDLPELNEGVMLKIPKIPFRVFNYIVSFMKKIYEKDKTESTIMVFYDQDANTFSLFVPAQENSAANSKYNRADDPEYERLCQEKMLCLVAHSHPWTATTVSPSGTDNNDEKESILYMIVGNVEKVPVTYCSTCSNAGRIKLALFDIFENPLEVEAGEISSSILATLALKYIPDLEVLVRYVDSSYDIPDSWSAKCKKSYGTSYYGYGTGYYNGYYGNYNRAGYSSYDGYSGSEYYDNDDEEVVEAEIARRQNFGGTNGGYLKTYFEDGFIEEGSPNYGSHLDDDIAKKNHHHKKRRHKYA